MINSIDIIPRQSKLNPRSLQHILLLSLFLIFYINPCFIFNKKESKRNWTMAHFRYGWQWI